MIDTSATLVQGSQLVEPSTTFMLVPGEEPGSGFLRVLTEQMSLARWHVRLIVEDDIHIHEVRKATKRIRAVLRMIRDEIGDASYRDANASLRDIARELSEARSSFVQLTVLDDLVSQGVVSEAVVDHVRSPLSVRAAQASSMVDEALVEDLLDRLGSAGDLMSRFDIRWEGADRSSGVRRTYRTGRRTMARAYDGGSDDDFHVWRKQVKYLRHQMEVLRKVGPEATEELHPDLVAIGDALGTNNDLVDVIRTVQELPEWSEKTVVVSTVAHQRDSVEAAIQPLATLMYGPSPRAFVDRVIPSDNTA